jgi:predicted ATPase/DNA-binding SARP family transcriptional activator
VRLTLHLLGPPEVHLEGEPVTGFVSDKARALLFYLAVEAERAHRRETLAGLLWPDYPERSARTNLSNTLSNLRSVLADREATPPYLLVTRDTIQFNARSDHRLDATAFEALVDDQRWEEAAALYQGGFLEGFSLPDSAPFEGWALVTRERLQRQVMAALEGLAAEREEGGDYARAIEAARRQLEIEPWHEKAHRALMRDLALLGERASALAQYEQCRRALQEELGVEPSPETVQLAEQIRDGRLSGPVARDAQPPVVERRHNLPIQLTPFVGREGELVRIQDRLIDPNCRLLTLVGPGGSGKTRLALEAAGRLIDLYRDGVFFVSLASLQSAEFIVPAIAQALGFSFYEGREMRQQLLDYLRQKHLLLVLDNVEHLLGEHLLAEPTVRDRPGAALLVTDVLKAAPEVKIVATSRARLDVQGEHLFPVEGMDVPDEQAVAEGRIRPRDVGGYSAIQLFAQGARQVQPDFEWTANNVGNAVRICRLVEGMPLAILLAAAWVRLLSPAEIVVEIARGIDFLATDARDVPQRQRSVRAVFNHSWNLLDERKREAFAALSVFRGGFTRMAAQAVARASLRELAALVDRSLVHHTPTSSTGPGAGVGPEPGGRYEVHVLLRQYAEEKLEDAGRGNAVRDAHSAYYAAALGQWAADLKGTRQQTALAEMEVEIDNARAAWEWALGQRQVDRLALGIDGLCTFYECRGRFEEGASSCQKLAQRLASPAEDLTERARLLAKVLVWQSAFCRILGDTEGAERLLAEATGYLEERVPTGKDARPEKALLLLEAGRVAFQRGDHARAGQYYTQSETLYRAIGDTWGVAQALSALGQVMHLNGEFDSAEGILQESLALQQSLGDRRGMARTLIELSSTNIDRGRPEEAERLARQATSIRQEIGDPSGVANGLFVITCIHVFRGQFAEACSMFEDSIAVQRRLGNRVELAWGYSGLAWTQCNLGLYDQAWANEEEALAIWQETGYRDGLAMDYMGLGGIALAREAFSEARDWFEHSLTLSREIGNRRDIASSLAHLGLAERGLGRPALAWQHLGEALRTAAEIGSRAPILTSLAGLAVLLADEGDVERALALYALATRYPDMRASRYYEDITGRYVDAAAATLPPERIEAARERGRARDLDATVMEVLAACEARGVL